MGGPRLRCGLPNADSSGSLSAPLSGISVLWVVKNTFIQGLALHDLKGRWLLPWGIAEV